VEVVGEFVVEHPGADLEQHTAWRPSHLHLLNRSFADDLVDGRLDERGGDGLASPVTLPVIGDRTGVRLHVSADVANRFEQLGMLGGCFLDVEVGLQITHGLQGSKHLAVPQEPLQALQLRGEVGREVRFLNQADAFGHLSHDGEAHRDVEPEVAAAHDRRALRESRRRRQRATAGEPRRWPGRRTRPGGLRRMTTRLAT
jgi:hypothetical protein